METQRGDAELLRKWAVETVARCMRLESVADLVLLCQLADLLVNYRLTGRPIVEALTVLGSLLQ